MLNTLTCYLHTTLQYLQFGGAYVVSAEAVAWALAWVRIWTVAVVMACVVVAFAEAEEEELASALTRLWGDPEVSAVDAAEVWALALPAVSGNCLKYFRKGNRQDQAGSTTVRDCSCMCAGEETAVCDMCLNKYPPDVIQILLSKHPPVVSMVTVAVLLALAEEETVPARGVRPAGAAAALTGL